MAVVVTALFRPREGAEAELIDAFRKVIPAIHDEPGCLLYSIHAAANGTITMIEKWDSQDQLDAHSNGKPVDILRASTAPYLASPAEVTVLTPIPIGDARGAL